MAETIRTSDGLDPRRRRLLFRAWRRGTRELDLIVGAFADARLRSLTETELTDFEALLEVPDPDLYAWLMGAADVPAEHRSGLFRSIAAFHGADTK